MILSRWRISASVPSVNILQLFRDNQGDPFTKKRHGLVYDPEEEMLITVATCRMGVVSNWRVTMRSDISPGTK